jgi:hypothetical protein
MPINDRDPRSRTKLRNPEIKDADPPPLVSEENPSRVSSIENGNTANGNTDSGVPARGSGGPRTERGKKKSSRNAIKHAIFSAVVLPDESPKMYRDILHALCDYFDPNDRVEQIFVEKLAANLWRYKRLILAETVDVAYTSGRAQMEMMLAGSQDLRNRENNGRMMADDASPEPLERAIELLRKLRALVQERGFDIDADVTILFKLYGPAVEGHLPIDIELIYGYWQKYSEVNMQYRPKDRIRVEEAKKQAIDMLDAQIRWAESRRGCLKPFENARAVLSFPSEIALEKIMRYEAHLGREFDRTL